MNQSWRQSKQKSLNCPWLPSLFMLWPLVNYLVYFTTSSLRNHYEWERVLDRVWEDGLCKIHSIKCSKIVFLPQMPNIIFSQTFYKICCLQHICCVRPQGTVKEVERDLSSYNLYLLKNVVWYDALHQWSEKLFPARVTCPWLPLPQPVSPSPTEPLSPVSG